MSFWVCTGEVPHVVFLALPAEVPAEVVTWTGDDEGMHQRLPYPSDSRDVANSDTTGDTARLVALPD